MHLIVSSARSDDKAEGRGLTNRSWEQSDEHAKRRMRQASYGRAELSLYYSGQTCPCQVCTRPRARSNLAQIAYKKPAYMSSRWRSKVVPCMGNNGNDNQEMINLPHTSPNGVNSGAADKRAWWWVDLLDIFTIDSVTVTLRNEYWDTEYFPTYYTHWYDAVITIDAEICHNYGRDTTFLSQVDAGIRQVQVCNRVMRGRHVMVQKQDYNPKAYPHNIMSFCELAVYACLRGYYWKKSENKCVACTPPCKYLCDNYAGCNTIYKYNVVAKKKNVEMSPLSYGVATTTTDLRRRSALSANYKECVSSTSSTVWKYWRVTFGHIFYVFSFFVTPTNTYKASTMTNMHFLVMRRLVNLGSKIYAESSEICHVFTGAFHGYRQEFTCINAPLLGSNAVIQAPPSSTMNFCEVEVMGYIVYEIGLGNTGCGELLTSFCEKEYVCDNKICKIPIGGNCARSHRRAYCHSRGICDGGTCKLKLNERCRDTTERDQCKIETECDPTANYQCKIVPGGPCQTADECSRSTSYTCDYLRQCKLKVGEACSRSADCVSGATCSSKTCECDVAISQPSGDFCVPQSGFAGSICGNSSSSASCTTLSTCENNICKCEDGYAVFPVTLTCERFKGANSDCSSVPCVTGFICEGNKCKLDVRDRCTKTDECRGNALCDENVDACRLRPGEQCQSSSVCGTTSLCFDGICLLVIGESCTQSDDKCSSSTKCSTNVHNTALVCLLKLGQSCFLDNKTMCEDGAVCDKDNMCRVPRGEQCSTSNAKYCALSTECKGGSCRLLQGSTCQSNGTQCLPGLVCDVLGQCSIPENGDCTETPEGCLAGARCNLADHTCQCQTADCIPGSGMIGSNCTVTTEDPEGKESCNDITAICDRDRGICLCNAGYENIRANFSCGQGVGSSCNSSRPCTAGLACDYGNTCVVAVGKTCEGRKGIYCGRDAFCDVDEFCRSRSGADCRSRKDMCQLGLACDATGVCKVPLNKECHYNEVCAVGSNCNLNSSLCMCTEGIAKPTTQGDSCEPSPGRVGGDCTVDCLDPNSKCNNDTCKCSSGYTVNNKDFTCNKDLGQSCANDGDCGPGASCDSEKKCSLLLGQSCRGKLKGNCAPLDVCDKNDECKHKRQGKCNRDDLLPCEAGTFCDWLGTCSLGVGSPCETSSECPVGAVCLEALCACDEDKSVPYDISCKPAEGRVGADCDEVSSPCTMPGAKCVNGFCQCDEGVKTTTDFQCAGVKEKKETPKSGVSMVGLIGGLAASLLLCCGLGFVIFKRNKKSKEKAQELIKERAKSMADLSALAFLDADKPAQSDGNAAPAEDAIQADSVSDNAVHDEPSSAAHEESVDGEGSSAD